MSKLFLGIDTSNYKTSVAAIDELGSIVFNRSEYLDVKQGEKGLRQSEAFFKHSNILPEFIEDAFHSVNPCDIAAIGVSTRPRRVDGSYMPCFLAGHNLARELSSTLSVPVYSFSHQEGHAAAAMLAHPELFKEKSLFYHLSGGTTEFLLCSPDADGFSMEIIGGTKDISFGQLLDRIGVKMGMQFPSGIYLDELASNCDLTKVDPDTLNDIKQLVSKPKVDDGQFNLSGLETKLLRYIDQDSNNDKLTIVIKRLFIVIADLLSATARDAMDRYQIGKTLMAGGVASSSTIRSLINDSSILFGEPELSGDNAVGVAILSKMKHIG